VLPDNIRKLFRYLLHIIRLYPGHEELVVQAIPAIIIPVIQLTFYCDKRSKTTAAFPTTIALEFCHTGNRILTGEIKNEGDVVLPSMGRSNMIPGPVTAGYKVRIPRAMNTPI
jgi:hypothetical protein